MSQRLWNITLYGVGVGLGLVLSLFLLDRVYEPDLKRYIKLSTEITDKKGEVLRVFLSDDGYVRLPVKAADVDPDYIRMLIAYEDKRFYDHSGVDVLAFGRALWQAAHNGRIVSGGSTLTMQVARLLEPRPRTVAAKLKEMFRAWQLERRFSKKEILSIYLTIAPYGGNREGVRAASLVYFDRPPTELTLSEAALLVALPQSPAAVRPDRHPVQARRARNKVLERVRETGAFDDDLIRVALGDELLVENAPLPFIAPHLTRRLKESGGKSQLNSSLEFNLQFRLESNLRAHKRALGDGMTAAVLIVDNRTRQVLAYAGSADLTDSASDGYVDMVRAIRSPGSTLKPFIYGMAFDRGLAHPETLIHDAPTVFGASYAPSNFLDRHYGDVTVRESLQRSLNVPAVLALDRVGPVSFVERLRRHDITMKLPGIEEMPGLAVALGGVGTSLEDLVKIYAALADDGLIRPLSYEAGKIEPPVSLDPVLGQQSRERLARILRHVSPPAHLLPERYLVNRRNIAFKTGTSYGFRDAWAIGYTRDHTVGVWVGRPDGQPNPGFYGANTAAPLLFDLFDLFEDNQPAHGDADPEIQTANAELSPGLQRLTLAGQRLKWKNETSPISFTYPYREAVLLMPPGGQGLELEVKGGAYPLTWVINGVIVARGTEHRRLMWTPAGEGFHSAHVIDGQGRRAKVDFRTVDTVSAALNGNRLHLEEFK